MAQSQVGVTELLPQWRDGDPEAERRVVSLVYDELRGLAGSYLRRERNDHTLQPTALVHEAYVRLVREKSPEITNRGHLLGIAARLMRQILVNHAVQKRTTKRGAGWQRIDLDHSVSILEERCLDLVDLDEALAKLSQIDERQSRIVELRFFGGLSVEDTAEVLKVSKRTVVHDWMMARAWLRREMCPT